MTAIETLPLAVTAEVTAEQMFITPAMAAAWLTMNARNRHLNDGTVSRYARDIMNGEWAATGETIKFDRDGNLLDGQHRLAAVRRAQRGIMSMVVRGLDPTVQDFMDTGRARRAGDVLTIRGEINGNLLAATAALAIAHERGTATPHLGSSAGGLGSRLSPTNAERFDWIERNGDVRQAVQRAGKRRVVGISPAVLCYAYFRLRRIDPDQADEFVNDLVNHVSSGPSDPRSALLRRLGNAVQQREQIERAEQLALLFRTWNALREGKPLQRALVTSRKGSIPVPEPI